ncbi:hypothetical protein VPH49_23660 [Pseudomonas luteola]|uniref:hypothetical protein n=1 Tax=Pseudomonas luteola TaxID=47886 RepID=UPI003A8412BA
MAVTANQIQELYIGYFGRPADSEGLAYWTEQLNATTAALTLEGLASSFTQQPEYTDVYEGMTRSQIVTTIYENLFNRSASSNEQVGSPMTSAELNYWVNESGVSNDQLIIAMINGATGNDRVTLDNKITVSTAYTAATAGSTFNVAVAQGVLDNVTYNTASIETALEAFSSDVNDATPAFTGALGNVTLDAFDDASIEVTGPELTQVNVSGTIDNTDAATVTLSDAGTDTLVLNLNVSGTDTATGADAATLVVDTADFTGLETVNGANSSANLDLTLSSQDLTSVTTGSGADTVNVTSATALASVATGAGNDEVTASLGNVNLTIDLGAGTDTLNLTAVAATGTAATAHTTTVTLGAGNDVLTVSGLENLVGTFSSANTAGIEAANTALTNSLVSVTDFNASQDSLDVSGLVANFNTNTLTNVEAGTISGAASLYEALGAAITAYDLAPTPAPFDAMHFQYQGNTYVFVDTDASSSVTATDGLIELTGFTGQLTDANFTA